MDEAMHIKFDLQIDTEEY